MIPLRFLKYLNKNIVLLTCARDNAFAGMDKGEVQNTATPLRHSRQMPLTL